MARLVLLDVSMLFLLLVGAGIPSSIGWPYPEGDSDSVIGSEVMETNEAIIEDELVQEQTDDVSTQEDLQSEKDFEDANVVADYAGLSKTAEISQAGACDCDLRAYDQRSYRGRYLLMRQQNANFKNDYFNDRIESARVYGKCQWILYQDVNFEGKSYILSPGSYSTASKWSGTGNRISSARALPPKGTKAIVLFQHINYRGRMLVLYDSHSNLPAIDFNDQLSSFIIIGGHWSLYEHTNYKGRKVTLGPGKYSSPTAIGGAGGNDKISSIKAC